MQNDSQLSIFSGPVKDSTIGKRNSCCGHHQDRDSNETFPTLCMIVTPIITTTSTAYSLIMDNLEIFTRDMA
jgi:hypothetical protein